MSRKQTTCIAVDWKETRHFLLSINIIVFAQNHFQSPLDDVFKQTKCSCPHDVKLTFGLKNSQGGNTENGCKSHLRNVLLALIKLRQSSLSDVEFAQFTHKAYDAIILAEKPRKRESLLHILDEAITSRHLLKNESGILDTFQNLKKATRKRKLNIEDDNTKLSTGEELLKCLCHSLQKCEGVHSYSLVGKIPNLEKKFNPETVSRDEIITYINRQLKKSTCDTSVLIFIPSKDIVTFQLECFPGMTVLQDGQEYHQTLGVFFEIDGRNQKGVTTVTHGKIFDESTTFTTHTTDMIKNPDQRVSIGNHVCTVYNEPKPYQPDDDEQDMDTNQNDGDLAMEGASNIQPEDGFVDSCFFKSTEESQRTLNAEKGKCLVIANLEPKRVTQLRDLQIQKLGAASGLKYGKIVSDNSSIKGLLNGREVWVNNVVITEQDTRGLYQNPAAGDTLADLPTLSTETRPVGFEEAFAYPDAISQQGDSGAIITTLPQKSDQPTVDAISVHAMSYRELNRNLNKELSYSVSFLLGPAVKLLENKMGPGVKLRFMPTCIPDFEQRCNGIRYEFNDFSNPQ